MENMINANTQFKTKERFSFGFKNHLLFTQCCVRANQRKFCYLNVVFLFLNLPPFYEIAPKRANETRN